MMTIEEALKHERLGSLPISYPACVKVGTSLAETLDVMRDAGVGCVLVCEADERLVGIFTERDVLNKMLGTPVDLTDRVETLMTRDPRVLTPDDTLGEAIRLMTERGYRHVPLCDRNGKQAGMITARDIVHYVAEHFPAEVVNLPPRLHQKFATPEGA